MTEIQPAHYTDGACHTAQGDRQVISSFVCSQGVAIGANGGSDLEVVQRGAGANMSVDVGSGNAFVEGTEVGWQGMYHVSNDGTVNVAIAAADPTDDRIDLVVARVYDATYSGTDREWAIEVVTGTPSPAPAPPALPDNTLLLATVDVAAGATSITTSDITDERHPYGECGTGGGLLDTLIYEVADSGSAFTKASYPTMTHLEVEVQGGGGGGGGAFNPISYGSGGGSGGYAKGIITEAALGASETVTVGAGGAGGVNNSDGANGSTSSFGAHISCGGGGFGRIAGADPFIAGGSAGSVITPPTLGISVVGQNGEDAWNLPSGADELVHVGSGADSMMGLGGQGFMRVTDAPGGASGRVGRGYGSGGSGAYENTSLSGETGGDGADGIVIVRVYG